MNNLQKEQETFYNLLSPSLEKYVKDNLKASLSSIHFSKEFVSYLLSNLGRIDITLFYKKFNNNLAQTYTKGFFQDIVPNYFNQNVIPHIPPSKYIIDIGCGTGILAHNLSQLPKFKKIEGIDLAEYPEWKLFSSEKVIFRIIHSEEFEEYLASTPFDNAVLTWSLHHMPFDEQQKYLRNIYTHLKKGGIVTVLEDSYSEKLKPRYGINTWKKFMSLSPQERQKVMSFYDWVTNRILAKRHTEPIPCTYRTLEQWSKLGKRIGFKVSYIEFIGFPEHRDINTPQSLIVFKK